MIEIRFHGRGGQGAVIASNILASAMFKEGKWAQSFPLFGGERRGAPVTAFFRADDERILIRGGVYEPDHIVVLDPTLLMLDRVTVGLKPGGSVIVNSPKDPRQLDFPPEFRVGTVDANAIAVRLALGTPQAPVVNTAILGALARVTQIVGLEALQEAIREEVPIHRDNNARAAREAFDAVKVLMEVGQ